jgi:hypothetical protein
MVYWGTTDVPERSSTSPAGLELQNALNLPPDDPQKLDSISFAMQMTHMEDMERDSLDGKNAGMLGYTSPDDGDTRGIDYWRQIDYTALGKRHNDWIAEIEQKRYFVVLMAYDFQVLWREKKHKLLWETRFSINQQRNDFAKALPVMANKASRYFGQDSHGLIRQQVPEGRVEVGEPTLVQLLLDPRK